MTQKADRAYACDMKTPCWCLFALLPSIQAQAGTYVVTFNDRAPLAAHVEADLPACSAGAKPRHHHERNSGSATRADNAAKWSVASDGPLHLAYDVDLSFAKEKWPYGNEQAGANGR